MMAKDIKNTGGNPKESIEIIRKAMEVKSDLLKNKRISSAKDVMEIFSMIFYLRRSVNSIVEQNSIAEIASAIEKLRDTSLPYEEREKALITVKGAEKEDLEDASREIIHFIQPGVYPLWTRWIWNPMRNTGSLTYVLKEGVRLENKEQLFSAFNEIRTVLETFNLNTGNYYGLSIFLVYAYVRYLDYTTLLAVDKKAAGLLPTHLSTTAMVLGVKQLIRGINYANS
ncbi:hypothetical protein HS7_01180 [Sulfolobales archaeon HS-7]|nr:hypothetical protein HS7_01180 [Sulfolobales archaeon HS-7]